MIAIHLGEEGPRFSICVINGEGDPLLGMDTATSLSVLKIGIAIAAVSAEPKTIGGTLQQGPNVFSGVGKLKDRAVQLHINPNGKPVAQPMRRTPFTMRPKLEEKIKELVELNIIEPAQGPTPWVNPIVVVPKSGGDIDMQRVNEAIWRAQHPIPTVDEITQSISGSKVFSKLPQNSERSQRLLPIAVCSDTRDYCLVLTLLPNSISTRSRRHLQV